MTDYLNKADSFGKRWEFPGDFAWKKACFCLHVDPSSPRRFSFLPAAFHFPLDILFWQSQTLIPFSIIACLWTLTPLELTLHTTTASHRAGAPHAGSGHEPVRGATTSFTLVWQIQRMQIFANRRQLSIFSMAWAHFGCILAAAVHSDCKSGLGTGDL